MTRLRSLIKEVLSQPKKKDCNCGCNDCGGKAPILTEGKVKHLISEGLQYHMDKKIQLHESVYRIGSEKHFALINEARKLWVRGLIDVSEDDQAILETHLGNFGMYEGEAVPLDMPMVNEDEAAFEYNKARAGRIMKDLFGPDFEFDYTYKLEGDRIIIHPEGYNPDGTLFDMKDVHKEKIIRTFRDKMPKAQATPNMGGGITVRLRGFSLNESKKKKKKDPPIGKPKRGGPKAYYVYVRDPKTKKIKKVTFGSGGLKAKIRNKKARNAFAARHRCKTATDRTTARYWSCRLPRYAKQLGLGSNMNTFW